MCGRGFYLLEERASSIERSSFFQEEGHIKFVLLQKIGRAVLDTTVTEEEILAAIDEINFTEEDEHE